MLAKGTGSFSENTFPEITDPWAWLSNPRHSIAMTRKNDFPDTKYVSAIKLKFRQI
jgi:hypothetical protein